MGSKESGLIPVLLYHIPDPTKALKASMLPWHSRLIVIIKKILQTFHCYCIQYTAGSEARFWWSTWFGESKVDGRCSPQLVFRKW